MIVAAVVRNLSQQLCRLVIMAVLLDSSGRFSLCAVMPCDRQALLG